jgi:pimeloyl-ACP methyl ester carboxylesterase
MAEWFSGDVTANGIKIHYYRTGGDKPVIVLCHGATDDGLCWTPVARALEADYDVIMPDARWHGLSAGPAGPASPAILANDLYEFVLALKLEKPILGGHSMGAHSAFLVTAHHPALMRATILEDPAFRESAAPVDEEQLKKRSIQMREGIMANRGMTREALIAKAHQQSPLWSEEELGPWADSKLRVSPNLAELRFGQPGAATLWEDLAKITCPVLLITADPDKGAIVTPETAQKAAQIASSLTVVRIPGAGHNIRREGFAAYMQAVRTFLASIG